MFGVAIRVHVTLLALFAWIIIASPLRTGFPLAVVEVATVLSVFAIILAHELAHALVARKFGSQTKEILLLPIGGIANIDKIPRRPGQELLVAIAGPALNVVFASLIALVLAVAGADFFPGPTTDLQSFGAQLLWINIVLAGFNLVPAFPMDGGRALRALLAMRMGYTRATRIAVTVGYAISIGFIALGVLYNPMLALVGIFVWTVARQELARTTVRERLRGTVARDAMIRALDPVDPDDDPYNVADRMLADGVRLLPVVSGQHVLGVITTIGVLRRLHGRDPHDVIRGVTCEVPVVTSDTPLVKVVDALDDADAVLVVDDGVLVGLLTLDQIEMFGELADEPGIGPFPRTLAAR
jgi:Zn-dependent protease/predicted transcriptional regulator